MLVFVGALCVCGWLFFSEFDDLWTPCGGRKRGTVFRILAFFLVVCVISSELARGFPNISHELTSCTFLHSSRKKATRISASTHSGQVRCTDQRSLHMFRGVLEFFSIDRKTCAFVHWLDATSSGRRLLTHVRARLRFRNKLLCFFFGGSVLACGT